MISSLNIVKQGWYGLCGDYILLMYESLMSQVGLYRFRLCPELAYVGFVGVLNWLMWFFYILNIGWRNEVLHQQTFALFPFLRFDRTTVAPMYTMWTKICHGCLLYIEPYYITDDLRLRMIWWQGKRWVITKRCTSYPEYWPKDFGRPINLHWWYANQFIELPLVIDESTEFPWYIAISILLYMYARYIIGIYIRIYVSLPTRKFFIRFDFCILNPKNIINTLINTSYFHRTFIVFIEWRMNKYMYFSFGFMIPRVSRWKHTGGTQQNDWRCGGIHTYIRDGKCWRTWFGNDIISYEVRMSISSGEIVCSNPLYV